jgi:GTP-binding protein
MKRPEVTFERPYHRIADLPRDGMREICISGRSNVGKSSLLNRLSRHKGLAKVSGRPGKTQALNYFTVNGEFRLVDLPGYGYAHLSKKRRNAFGGLVDDYLNGQRRELVGVIQLIDSRHGPVAGDYDMLDWLGSWSGDILFVCTKSDKLSAQKRSKAKQQISKECGVENCVLFSAVTGTGADAVLGWMFDTVARNKSDR